MSESPSLSNISLTSKNGSISTAAQLRAYPDRNVDTRQLLTISDDNLRRRPHNADGIASFSAEETTNTTTTTTNTQTNTRTNTLSSGFAASPSPSNITLSSKNATGSICSFSQVDKPSGTGGGSPRQARNAGEDSNIRSFQPNSSPRARPYTMPDSPLRSRTPSPDCTINTSRDVPQILFDLGSNSDLSLGSGPVTPHQKFRRKTQAEINYGYTERRILILGGWALSFNAGFINAVLLSCQFSHSVSFVSGTVSTSGVAMGNGEWAKFGELFGLWFSYYIGGVISALMIPNRKFKMGFAYGRVLLVVCALLLGSYFAIQNSVKLPAWYQAALALGMQNAITTTFDGAVVRTTHYTGMTTDLAILTAYAMTGRVEKSEYWKFVLFVPQLLSFFCGNIVGVLVYHHQDIQARALFIPAFVSGTLGIMYVFNLSQIFNTSFFAMMQNGQEGVEDGTATWMTGAKYIMENAADKLAKGEETRSLLDHQFPSYSSLTPAISSARI